MLHVFIASFYVSNCVEGHIHGMMYMGIVIARLLRRKLYAWCNAYKKKGEC